MQKVKAYAKIFKIFYIFKTCFGILCDKYLLKVTPTTFWLKCKNLSKRTKFCSTRKLKVAAKNFGLLARNCLMHWQIPGNFCVVCLNL